MTDIGRPLSAYVDALDIAALRIKGIRSDVQRLARGDDPPLGEIVHALGELAKIVEQLVAAARRDAARRAAE